MVIEWQVFTGKVEYKVANAKILCPCGKTIFLDTDSDIVDCLDCRRHYGLSCVVYVEKEDKE